MKRITEDLTLRRVLGLFLLLCLLLSMWSPAVLADDEDDDPTPAAGEPDAEEETSGSGFTCEPDEYGHYFEDETQKELYDTLLDGLRTAGVDDTVRVSQFQMPNDKEHQDLLNRIFKYVLVDHPELFWYKGGYIWYHNSANIITKIKPKLYADFSDAGALAAAQTAFNVALDRAVACAREFEDPVERLVAVYDILVSGCVYNWEVGTGNGTYAHRLAWNAYGALVMRDCVCKGIAKAYAAVFNTLDDPRIHVRTVAGMTSGGAHVWNMVRLDGVWYHLDPTKGIGSLPTMKGNSTHSIFLASDAFISSKSRSEWHERNAEYIYEATDTRYESGWAFSDCIDSLHKGAEGWYYLKKDGYRKYNLYCGPLNGAGTMIAQIPLRTRAISSSTWRLCSGIAWVGDCLYYVNEDDMLACYCPAERTGSVLGPVPFEYRASPDGYYKWTADGVGVWYDWDTGEIVCESRTVRDELARYTADPEHDWQPAAATVGGTRYFTLQAAIDAAGTGDTVTLLGDVNETVYIRGEGTQGKDDGNGADELTLDLYGHTLSCLGCARSKSSSYSTSSFLDVLSVYGSVTVLSSNGTGTVAATSSISNLDVTYMSCMVVYPGGSAVVGAETERGGTASVRMESGGYGIIPVGSLTVNNCELESEKSGIRLSTTRGTANQGGALEVELWDGIFRSAGTVLYNGASTALTVRGGSYASTGGYNSLYLAESDTAATVHGGNFTSPVKSSGMLFITGGSFSGSFTLSGSTAPDIRGGTFTGKLSFGSTAEGYVHAGQFTNENYSSVTDAVLGPHSYRVDASFAVMLFEMSDGTVDGTAAELIGGARSGDSLTLLQDVTLEDTPYTVLGSGTALDLNGNTLTVQGGLLVLGGSVTDGTTSPTELGGGTVRLTEGARLLMSVAEGDPIPLWNEEEQGYQFVPFSLTNASPAYTEGAASAIVGFVPSFGDFASSSAQNYNTAAMALLGQDGQGHLTIRVCVEYTTQNGYAHADSFSPDSEWLLTRIANLGYGSDKGTAVGFRLKGLDALRGRCQPESVIRISAVADTEFGPIKQKLLEIPV